MSTTRTRAPRTYTESATACCDTCGWTEDHEDATAALDAATLHKYGFRKAAGTVFGQVNRPDLLCPEAG